MNHFIDIYKNKFLPGKTRSARLVSYFLCLIFIFSLISCIDEKIVEPDPNPIVPGDSDGFRITLNYNLPDDPDTRSFTSNSGGSTDDNKNDNHEDATNPENTLNASLILVPEDGHTLTFPPSKLKSNTDSPIVAEIKPSIFASLLGQKIDVYIISNVGLDSADPDDIFSMGMNVDESPLGFYMKSEETNGSGNSLPIANKSKFEVNLEDITVEDGATDSQVLRALEDKLGIDGEKGFKKESGHCTFNLSDYKKFQEKVSVTSVELERAVARVDFKPAKGIDAEKSTSTTKVYLGDNIYQIGVVPNLFAKMSSLQLINVSRQANVFRHTSKGDETLGYPEGITSDFRGNVFGKEKDNDNFGGTPNGEDDNTDYSSYYWMADSDWKEKLDYLKLSETTDNWSGPFVSKTHEDGTTNYFMNQPTKELGDPCFYVHEDKNNKLYGLIGIEELDTKCFKGTDDFYRWCYVSENTLPSTDAMIRGLSTGVAFSMILTDKDGNPLKDKDFVTRQEYNKYLKDHEAWEDKDTWMKENDINDEESYYNSKPQDPTESRVLIEEELKAFKPGSDYFEMKIGNQSCYIKKISYNPNGEEEDDDDEEIDNPEAVDNEESYAYEVIYYYFFRHNFDKENHVLGTTGPMQFGVVRNNIYKLSVTALNDLPVPYDPSDPDEPQNTYMSVELKVLAWARRDITVTW